MIIGFFLDKPHLGFALLLLEFLHYVSFLQSWIMQRKQGIWIFWVIFSVGFSSFSVALGATDPNDVRILNEFRKGLENPELLQWPKNGDDPCGPPLWKHVFCSGNRVTQIQIQGLGLKGTLPKDFNQLSKLQNLGFQRNNFHGSLPSFSGLSELEFAYLDFNNFDEIPSDFFDGLDSIRVLELDDNPLNATTGWSLPQSVGNLTQLANFSLGNCNLVGPLPDYLGSLPSLSSLRLSYNRLSGVLPLSFNQSMLQILWLNDQAGEGMTGPIDVVTSLPYLTQLWLHGNSFAGTIPENIGDLASLEDLNLNRNKLVGVIPQSLASMDLRKLDLSNNMLMGPIPKFKSGNVSYASNSFCQPVQGAQCSPQVNALIDFLGGVSYPVDVAPKWSGNDPCEGPWLGLGCVSDSKVLVLNLPNRHLNGTLSPSVARLDSLREIRLAGNYLTGQIPANLTQLKSLRLLVVSGNNFEPPLPKFHSGVKLVIAGNPSLAANHSARAPAPTASPAVVSSPPVVRSPLPTPLPDPSRGGVKSPPSETTHSPAVGSKHGSDSLSNEQTKHGKSKKFIFLIIIASIAGLVVVVLLSILFYFFCCKKKKGSVEAPCSVVVHPRDPSDPDNVVKVAFSGNITGSFSLKPPVALRVETAVA